MLGNPERHQGPLIGNDEYGNAKGKNPLTRIACDVVSFIVEDLSNRIDTRRRGEVWPKVFSDVLHSIDTYAIGTVVSNQSLDPVVVSRDDLPIEFPPGPMGSR